MNVEAFSAAHWTEQNGLLRALPDAEYANLLAQLEPVHLSRQRVLATADGAMEFVYFPREGVCSVVASMPPRGSVEVGAVGREGFVGLAVLFRAPPAPYTTMVQIEGHAGRLSAGAFSALIDERPLVRHLMLRYAQYYIDQVSQSVACNRLHTLEQRCARWLLVVNDRVRGDSFEITHNALAQMLGVRRAGVTVALGSLEADGLIRTERGRVSILDLRGLEAAACSCYGATRGRLERLVDSSTAAGSPTASQHRVEV